MELSKFTQKQRMCMEKYNLEDGELEDSILRIIDYVKIGKEPSERPIAVIVGGQPGAGKSGVIGNTIEKLDSNCVVVDNDDYRHHHPRVDEINAECPEIFTECTDQLSFAATPRVIADLIENKYNLVIHQTLKNDTIIKCAIKDLMEAGYTVVIRALAVSELKSNMSMIKRCQDQIAIDGTCRWVPQNNHDYAYNGLPETVGKIEQLGAYHLLEVLTRAENDPNHPNIIYRKRNKNMTPDQAEVLKEHYFGGKNILEYPNARAAVYAGRDMDLQNMLETIEEKIDVAKQRATTPEESRRIAHLEQLHAEYTSQKAAKKPE